MSSAPNSDNFVISGDLVGLNGLVALKALYRILVAAHEKRSAFYDAPGMKGLRRSPYAELMIAAFQLYHESEDWKQQRQKCLESRGGKCNCCEAEASTAHHANYSRWSRGDDELTDLVPLCGGCHVKEHNQGEMRARTPFFAQRATSADWVPHETLAALMKGFRQSDRTC